MRSNGKWAERVKHELINLESYDPDSGVSPKNYLIDRLQVDRVWEQANPWRRTEQGRLEGLGEEDPVNQSWCNMLYKFPCKSRARKHRDALRAVRDQEKLSIEHRKAEADIIRAKTEREIVVGEQRLRTRMAAHAKAASKKMEGFDYTSDAEWVYHNLPLEEPNLETAPSPGAIGLLGLALDDPKHFYRQYGPKMLTGQGEDDEDVSSEKKTTRARLDMFESFVADCQKKTKVLEDGEKERGANQLENGRSRRRNTHSITLLHPI